MKHDIAIIGPREIILGFKAIGLKTFFTLTPEETLEKLKELKEQNSNPEQKRNWAIIFILESHAKEIPADDYQKLTADPLPAIIALPGPEGSTGFGLERLGQIVEKAVGSNLLQN